jgi:heme-degrading monooxygenase HmoA
MFSVIFEVNPRDDQWEAYFGYAALLRPELIKVDGFIDNTRYRSRRRPGWILSHSTWRDEKALIRWRTVAVHNDAQANGRRSVFSTYHLRVGQVTSDSLLPPGQALPEQRLDETETGASKLAEIVEARDPGAAEAERVARNLGLAIEAPGLIAWDIFDAVLTPGDILLLASWRDVAAADAVPPAVPLPGLRRRRVRIVRDYGMFDRDEAPQYFPAV